MKDYEYRPCIVRQHGKTGYKNFELKGLFHKWINGPMKSDQLKKIIDEAREFNIFPQEISTIVLTNTLGIVELEDGTILEAAPFEISFLDSEELFKEYVEKEELDATKQLDCLKKIVYEKYGVNISDDWLTATEQSEQLNRAYLRGVADERKRIMKLIKKEESNND